VPPIPLIPRRLTLIAAGLLCAVSLAAKPPVKAPAAVRPRLDPLTASLQNAATRPPARLPGLSIEVVELDTGKVVFEKNSDKPQTLASVSKMLSTAAAIHYLGPDYKFKTTFWRKGEVKDTVLTGSLLVVGGGDPNISGRFYNDDFNAVFDKWAEGLKQVGISRITGDLVLNAAFFDAVGRHPDWPAGQENKWYQAPTSALSYNDNVVYVSIGPGHRIGQPASITIEPESGLYKAVSRAHTTGLRGRVSVAVKKDLGSDEIEVVGYVPYRPLNWTTPITIDDPPLFFGNTLKKRLLAAGIQVDGEVVRRDEKPDTWTLVARTESDIVPTMSVCNKRSQGFYAEQIFKTMAAEKAGQGSWDAAVALQQKFFAALGLDPTHFQIHDGSGLSHENRVAAADVVAFLRAMSGQPYGQVWRSTLATAGEPGSTLQHRFLESDMEGRLQAKTGSVNNVSTLAGYLTANSGKTYAFAILLSGGRVNEFSGHAYQDRLIRALVKNG
jgi:D-alanyl-D-alanine carboxypeptidase/D-alanyl-D-alanine-endopeptidase (penicillin-binding protein 4)